MKKLNFKDYLDEKYEMVVCVDDSMIEGKSPVEQSEIIASMVVTPVFNIFGKELAEYNISKEQAKEEISLRCLTRTLGKNHEENLTRLVDVLGRSLRSYLQHEVK